MDLPFVNVLCVQTRAQRSAGPLAKAGSDYVAKAADEQHSSITRKGGLSRSKTVPFYSLLFPQRSATASRQDLHRTPGAPPGSQAQDTSLGVL